MRKVILTVLTLTLVAGVIGEAAAHGRRSRTHFDFYFGGPMWWGGDPFYRPYRYPYLYEPRTVIIEREPPVYIQRQPTVQQPAAPQTAPQPAQVWYYCTAPAGYYPYVQDCTQPWVSVDPRTVAPPPVR